MERGGGAVWAGRLARLHERAAALGWRCLADVWRGYDARYAFECANSHRFERLTHTVLQEVRTISLPAHLALVALRLGQGERDHTAELVQVLCRTNLMARSGADVDVQALRAAVMVLKGLIENVRVRGPGCAISEQQAEAVAQLLTIHDRLLETLPRRW